MHPDLDVVFVPGDIVAHAIALEYPPSPSYPTADYTELQATETEVADLFIKYFPDSIVLITEGNNDTKYHYQPAAPMSEKWVQDFYSETFDEFFNLHPRNSQLPELS